MPAAAESESSTTAAAGHDQRRPALTEVAPPPAVDPRVVWAAERTLLAWVRTGIGMMAFGVVLARSSTLLELLGSTAPHSGAETLLPRLGLAMVGVGALMNVDAARRYVTSYRLLMGGRPVTYSPATTAGLAVAVSGVGVLLGAWLLGAI